MELVEVKQAVDAIRRELGQVVVGQERVVDGLLVALLAEGHVLLEGPPGTAKTLMARCFSTCLGLAFNRVQFTPDLLPGDLLGTNLFDFRNDRFRLTKGPVFTDFLLADEINRTPPKTQAALLQAMQERQVTIDGTTHELSDEFLVVATQNPIEHEGTYPLPEAQLDRFLLKLLISFPSREEELEIVRRHGHRTVTARAEDLPVTAVLDRPRLAAIRETVRGVRLAEETVAYVVDLIRATREHPSLAHGASPRAASMLASAARALAVLQGRNFVIPDDVKELFLPTIRHRVILEPGAEVEGAEADAVLGSILDGVTAPR